VELLAAEWPFVSPFSEGVEAEDFVTVGLLVVLEALLSADNAMVLAILVLGLPKSEQRQALRYGIVGAFTFRIAATLLAVYLKDIRIVLLIGAAYLFWLPYQHFTAHSAGTDRRAPRPATSWLGLSPFWSTVAKVELTDIVFAIDSILVAVALSDKTWVIITGGLLGVIAMRAVIGQLLVLVNRYPALVDGAFVIIGWVAVKLVVEYLHSAGWIHFEMPKWLSLGLILVIFAVSLLIARREGPRDVPATDAEEILTGTDDSRPKA
jgi:YkoY family integral membrane protein